MMAVAVLTVVGLYADDYLYTKTARYKVSGENLIANGDFSANTDGWSNGAGGGVNAATWSVEEGEGPDGGKVLKSLGANEDPLCNVFEATPGKTYIVSYQIKATAAGSTSVTAGGNNYVDFFVNADGSMIKGTGTTVIDTVFTFSAADNFSDEWKTMAYAVTIPEGMENGAYIAIHIEKLVTDAMIADFKAYEAEQVYDVRIAQKRFAFVQQLLDDPNFNTAEAAAERQEVLDNIQTLTGFIESGEMDGISEAEDNMSAFNESVDAYLDVTSENLAKNSYFQYVEDLREVPSSNRGDVDNGAAVGGFRLRGNNWFHQRGMDANGKRTLLDNPYWTKYIGNTDQGPGSVALWNDDMPAGKYYIAAEMQNYNNSGDIYGLEREVKAFVGSDSVSCGMIKGEDFQRFYFVGELKEGEKFEAGFYWDGPYASTTFKIGYFEVRKFGESVADYLERLKAWKNFKSQWDAMNNARNKLINMIGDKNYPWSQQTLTDAQAKWDSYYNTEVAKGWVSEDGNDTKVATVDELTDWATYTGVTDQEAPYDKYGLVRGYQYATQAVEASNKVFADMADAIKKAESVRDDAMNANGDKETFQTAINTAQSLLDGILASTTDATRDADSTAVAEGQKALEEAVVVFEKSAEIPAFIDIDFSNSFEETLDGEGAPSGQYIIKGAKGQMEFGAKVTVDNTTGDNNFTLGFNGALNDILRVGNGEAIVNIEDITENDVIRASFDVWLGKLSKKHFWFEFRNADDVRIAGFKYSTYSGTIPYNDFNNEENTGLDVTKRYDISNVNNEAICDPNFVTSFDLVLDLKAQTAQGTLTASNKNYAGVAVPLTVAEGTDLKVAKIVVGSDYNNNGRRCWFDNLIVKKYASNAEGPVINGIETISVKAADNTVYTLSGMRVKGAVKPGLYIQNGKKVVIK